MKRNAVILAAGTSSRFVPLSLEKPKGLLIVKGEVLIERQIRQLKEAGIDDMTVVTGYKAEQFVYLKDKFGVSLVYNEDYRKYNNISSLIRVADRLADTFICSSDNYFPRNPFLTPAYDSYYSALYAEGPTKEYCMATDDNGVITKVSIGGHDEWYMIGHVYFNAGFSRAFSELMTREYEKEEIRNGYWEDLYISHISKLPPMMINKYDEGEIEEFDNLDELRDFDPSYRVNSNSPIMQLLTGILDCKELDLSDFRNLAKEEDEIKFDFLFNGVRYLYDSKSIPVIQKVQSE